jgi:hypothetical protein
MSRSFRPAVSLALVALCGLLAAPADDTKKSPPARIPLDKIKEIPKLKDVKRVQLSKREKRMLRWTLSFKKSTCAEYVKQMQELGAILAFPTEKEEYVVVRDLSKRPAEPKEAKTEDIGKMNRIYWFDKDVESVRSVCKLLGIKGSPEYFIAFFPKKLENELYEKELKYKNRKEDEIQETKFKVRRRGETLEVKVVAQEAVKR